MMGIDGQSQVLYISDVLQFAHFVAILQAQHQRNTEAMAPPHDCNDEMIPRQPCIIIDSNQVGMKMLKSAGGRIQWIGALIKVLSMAGIDVIVAVDGVSCYETKRAMVKHAAACERAIIMALQYKAELATLLHNNNQQHGRI